MAGSTAQFIMDKNAACADITFYQFRCIATQSAFYGSLLAADGQTIGQYAATTGTSGTTNFGGGGIFTASSLMSGVDATVTWGTRPGTYPPYMSPKYGASEVAGFTIPQSVISNLNYNTGALTGVTLTANSPVLGTMVSLARVSS